jgi:hypothetical protein
MCRVTFAAVLLLPALAVSEDKPDPTAPFRGSWTCVEQSGKKPTREVRLVVDKTGGYRMGGTGGETSDLASIGGVEGKLRVNPDRGEIDLVGSKFTLPGLYKIEGDRLTMLLGPRGARPTSWEKLDGTLHVFVRDAEKK